MWEIAIVLSLIIPFAIAGATVLVVATGYLEDRTTIHSFYIWVIGVSYAIVILLIAMMTMDYYAIELGIEDIFGLRE